MSTAPVVSDLQSANPSSIIELFTIATSTALHGSNTIYRIHAGINANSTAGNSRDIIWQGNTYNAIPFEASGFSYPQGQLPRPRLIISNGLGYMSTILLTVNQTTFGNDLTGAVVTRIRTMVKFLDAVNFSQGVNPFGTPDPTAEFPQEIYTIDRKKTENREVVEFELAAIFDMAGVRAPKRVCTKQDFPSVGAFTV